MEVTTNPEQKLYIQSFKGRVTCLGFDNVHRDIKAFIEILDIHKDTKVEPLGSLEAYYQREALVEVYAKSPKSMNTWFTPGTDPEVKCVTLEAYNSKQKIRIHFGDTETGESWLDENDVAGYVGRTTGPMRSPILLATLKHSGGCCILTDCILRIQALPSLEDLYQHPKYVKPSLTLIPDGKRVKVLRGEEEQASFNSTIKATHYIQFLRGERTKL